MKQNLELRSGRSRKPRQLNSPRYLIVSEGKKTEPNYFNGLKLKLKVREHDRLIYQNVPLLKVEGTGFNTISLVEKTQELVRSSKLEFENVYCVFDRDSFSKDDFNSAIQKCIKLNFIPLWSNECFELWFLLHFCAINSALSRGMIYDKLDRIFKEKRINKEGYEKNNENIYNILVKYGDQSKAIANAKALDCCLDSKYADQNPLTKVYLLIESLIMYL